MYKLRPLPFTNVTIDDMFWSPRLAAHRQATIPACLAQCESTGRIGNFAKAAAGEGEFEGIYFDDSDVYKVLEGIAYSLLHERDAALEAQADAIIAKIAAAQQPDGYLMCYFTLQEPEKKWTDMGKHEMYCAGHLIEAAIAYHQATGKDTLLQVAIKLADHIDARFGSGKEHWVPGHEEIELALVKLYHHVHDERYLRLAEFLLNERGHGRGKGNWIWDGKNPIGAAYCQDHIPVREQFQIEGHAVRAMYLYAAMADVAAVRDDQELQSACETIWTNLVRKRMYITGGVGSSAENEGVTEDYDLPNATAYCETCAAVGMVLWNHRMNLLTGEAKYFDVLERSLFNGALAGVSLQGDRFFYRNPLASDGTHHRVPWYGCACCPTQIARFLPSVGGYACLTDELGIYFNLYIQGQVRANIGDMPVVFKVETNYPWSGRVRIVLDMAEPMTFMARFRYPGWCGSGRLEINGAAVQRPEMQKGYLPVERLWKPGDVVELRFDMPVERCYAHPRVTENRGMVALQRGPLVYCIEEADQHTWEDCALPGDARYVNGFEEDLLGGVTTIQVMGQNGTLKFVPYCTWDNREAGRMAVWIKEEPRYDI